MKEIFEFARDKLHANYLFWSYKTYQGSPGAFTFTDALAVMKEFPSF